MEALKLTKILIAQNAMFIDNLFQDFNLILLFCCIILIFVNNQLNNINMIVLFSDFDQILKIGVNICVPSFNVCTNVNFDVNNAT